MTQHIFSFESELQNNQNEVAPSSPNFSLSVSEKLARYGVNALSDIEHLGLLVGKETVVARLLNHFGSLKTLMKASAVELGAFMTTRKAERLVAALAVSARAQIQNSFQEPFESPETVYRSCLDMQAFQQEVLRVVLLDTRLRRITAVDVTKGTLNESLGHPREVFRAAIVHSAYALAIVHNHPSGLCRIQFYAAWSMEVPRARRSSMRHKKNLLASELTYDRDRVRASIGHVGIAPSEQGTKSNQGLPTERLASTTVRSVRTDRTV